MFPLARLYRQAIRYTLYSEAFQKAWRYLSRLPRRISPRSFPAFSRGKQVAVLVKQPRGPDYLVTLGPGLN